MEGFSFHKNKDTRIENMRVKKQQLEPDMEQLTGSKLRKEYVKAVYSHPAYLACVQSTPWCWGPAPVDPG